MFIFEVVIASLAACDDRLQTKSSALLLRSLTIKGSLAVNPIFVWAVAAISCGDDMNLPDIRSAIEWPMVNDSVPRGAVAGQLL
jgi:hypothetical protein